jgi:hypothetical protein
VQDVFGRDWLPVNSDQVVSGLAVRQTLLEELGDRRSIGNLDRVGETAAVVVDEKQPQVCSFVFWELGRKRKGSGTSRRPCAQAVHYVEFVSRDGVDCVAPRALKFTEMIRNIVQFEDGAAARTIDAECRISAVLRLLRQQAEAEAFDEAPRLTGCASHRSLNLRLVHSCSPCWQRKNR